MLLHRDAHRANSSSETLSKPVLRGNSRRNRPIAFSTPPFCSAVWLDQPAVGSLWIPCRLVNFDEEAVEKALAVYFNSSIGLLALLGGRSNKVLSRPEFSMDALRSVPIPNSAR